MLIKVTKECIKKGVRGSPSYCPIALALKAAGCKNVNVDDSLMFKFGKPEQAFIRSYTEKQCNFISDFDEGKKVKPFNFIIKL